MPGAGAAIGAIVGAVASAVSSAASAIFAAISAAVGPAIAAIGSALSAVAGGIGSALLPITKTLAGISEWIISGIGKTLAGLVDVVIDTVGPFIKGIGNAIDSITAGITKAAEPILSPIRDGLQFIYDKVKAVEEWVTTALHPSAEVEALKTAHPEVWAASDGSVEVFRDLLVSRGIITSSKGALLLLPDAIETINQVATLKLLNDLVTGQLDIAALLGKVAEGSKFKTAQAIALLTKSIISTTVGIMDRVDTEVGILRAGIDTFDERLETSLREYAHKTEAEVLALITPRMDLLGDHALAVNRKIAMLTRHIDDEVWFAFMLLKVLG